ncbi:hypothetical protein C8N35_102239 [Breoghania corrubedonensis]|uniref:Uncharacterized protein n=1 Tax=Breoghania corrubedonensis TaxID=665038 RepID=A0A2T5VCP8_9HYPH|nr:hypothetical protein C8N35_102239 [Breoghania corrubedonensis]
MRLDVANNTVRPREGLFIAVNTKARTYARHVRRTAASGAPSC